MKLAVNYSLEAENLMRESSLDIDLFKCPDFSSSLINRAMEVRPCYIHFGLNAGSGKLDNVNWSHIEQLRKLTETPYINVHAVAFTKDYPGVDIFTTKPSDIQTILETVIRDIEMVGKHFGMENVIVENVVCRGKDENMLRSIIEPQLLTEIVTATGCGFLLDTAHAQMTSMCLGLDVRNYISQLPLSQLKELHITGIQEDENGRLRDSMPMTNEDWELASWAVQNIKKGEWNTPWVAAFEYGGVGPTFEWRTDKDILSNQLPILIDLIRN